MGFYLSIGHNRPPVGYSFIPVFQSQSINIWTSDLDQVHVIETDVAFWVITGYIFPEDLQKISDVEISSEWLQNSKDNFSTTKNFKKISGNFALACYSKIDSKVTVSTDILGTHTVYESVVGESRVLTTSLNAALSTSGSSQLDYDGFIASLANLQLGPEDTLYKQLGKLDPDSVYRFSSANASRWRYEVDLHQLLTDSNFAKFSQQECVEYFNRHLVHAISTIARNHRLVVPLSGGLDSGAIWSAALTHARRDPASSYARQRDFIPGLTATKTRLLKPGKSDLMAIHSTTMIIPPNLWLENLSLTMMQLHSDCHCTVARRCRYRKPCQGKDYLLLS